jgi:hypothetical protein
MSAPKTRDRDAQEALEQLRPVCPGCGRRFDPTNDRQVHCRPSCRTAKHEPDLLDVGPDAFRDGESEM